MAKRKEKDDPKRNVLWEYFVPQALDRGLNLDLEPEWKEQWKWFLAGAEAGEDWVMEMIEMERDL